MFPFTVLREEARAKYIDALEKADVNEFQPLVDCFAEVQKRCIEKALNLKEVSSSSFDEVVDIFSDKIENWQKKTVVHRESHLIEARNSVFDFCFKQLKSISNQLKSKLNGNANITVQQCSFVKEEGQDSYYEQIVKYAHKHNYYFNRNYPKGWMTFRIKLAENRIYQLCITMHHYGYDDTTLVIGAFLEFLIPHESQIQTGDALPLEIKPHVISLAGDVTAKEKNIIAFVEKAVTLTMAQIASEL